MNLTELLRQYVATPTDENWQAYCSAFAYSDEFGVSTLLDRSSAADVLASIDKDEAAMKARVNKALLRVNKALLEIALSDELPAAEPAKGGK